MPLTRREEIEEHKRQIARLTAEQIDYQPVLWAQRYGETGGMNADRLVPALAKKATMPVDYNGTVEDWVKDCAQHGFEKGDLLIVTVPADPKTPKDAPAHKQRVSLWEVRRTVSGAITVDAPQPPEEE